MGNSSDKCSQSEELTVTSKSVGFNIPEDLLLEVLSFVPAEDLLSKCCLVCHHWNNLINGHGIWRRKCMRDRRIIPKFKFENIPRNYYRDISIHNPYGKNLIKNPYGKEHLKYWTIIRSEGDGWTVEEPPIGSDPVPKKAGGQSCFATSYGDCIKFHVVDLIKNGVNKDILDHLVPDIVVGEWHTARFDCGSVYNLKVVLLDANRHEIDTFECGPIRKSQWTGRAWTEEKYVFSRYPPGVRFVIFEHSGKDTQYWAGHYGSKMTGGYVKLNVE